MNTLSLQEIWGKEREVSPNRPTPTIALSFWAYGIVLAAVAVYVPSLWFGFCEDDFWLLRTRWPEVLANPFVTYGRPIWVLSYLVVSAVSASSVAHHFVNVALFAAIAMIAVRLASPTPQSLLLVLACLAHPSLLWSVTWIAQRNDLLLILFVALAAQASVPGKRLAFAVLGAGAKTPFVLQGLFFALQDLKARRRLFAVAHLACVATFLYAAYATYYSTSVRVLAHRGLNRLGSDVSGIQAVLILAARSVKVAEGIFYSFVPLSAYPGHWSLAAGAVECACWAVVGVAFLRTWRKADLETRRKARSLLAIAVLLSASFAFGTHLRIYGPPVLFFYLAIGHLLEPSRAVTVALVLILMIHLGGVSLNYIANRTACFDLQVCTRYGCEPGTSCSHNQVPADRWDSFRAQQVGRMTDWIGSLSRDPAP
jgi:hypothetical protein